jgi:hypothetical protein
MPSVIFIANLAASVFWLLSSVAWVWAVQITPPLRKAEFGAPDGIVVASGPNGGLSVGGALVESYEKIAKYNREVMFRNRTAAGLSAAGALCAAVAVGLPAIVA